MHSPTENWYSVLKKIAKHKYEDDNEYDNWYEIWIRRWLCHSIDELELPAAIEDKR